MSTRSVLSDDVVQMAFDYLKTGSEEIAMARANVIRAEYAAKRVSARLFKASEGSVDMRKASATDHKDYAEAMERLAVAEETWERMKDQRNRAQLILDAWRTMESSDRSVRNFR
jgi:hypothetical protein